MEVVIKIPDELYMCVVEHVKDHYIGSDDVWIAVANGTPYNPTGDCISREALKEQINATDFDCGDFYDNTEIIRERVCEKIDSAQAIPLPSEQIAWEQGYEAGLAQGKHDRPTGDCISREALRKAIEEVEDNYDGYEPNDLGKFTNEVHDLIDNAQAVDLWQMRQEATENALKKAEVLYGRPKGEWKTVEGYDGDEYYECSNCGETWVLSAGTPKDNNMNFCPKCGADMKGGA